MTINKCFAIEYSGSTSHDNFYHNNVPDILKLKYQEGDEIIIWDTSFLFVSWNEYMEINREIKGYGGIYMTRMKQYDVLLLF